MALSVPGVLLDVARNPWLSVGGTITLGAIVAKVSNNAAAHRYYASLVKPFGNPPTWLLGPIWGTLYGMIGYASHVLVPVADSSPNPLVASVAEHALALYYVQLALNFIYMPIFFLAQRKWLAMGDITVITAMTWKLVDVTRDLPTSPRADLLLLPYALWMLYSMYLNVGLIYLNPSKVSAGAGQRR